jgi:hypothetical protein
MKHITTITILINRGISYGAQNAVLRFVFAMRACMLQTTKTGTVTGMMSGKQSIGSRESAGEVLPSTESEA